MISKNHDSGGRFTKGNKAAVNRGNPYTRKAAQFRRVLYNCVTEEQFKAICKKMTDDALNGSAKDRELFFTRLLGTPGTGIDLLERMERLETLLEGLEQE